VPQAQFHDRYRRARWGAVLRRSLPTLTALSLLGSVAMLARLGLERIEGAWMLLELPRFEIPPKPRRSSAPDWCHA
jgi:hypothetical protein